MALFKDFVDRVRRYCDGRDTREDLARLEFERACVDYDCSEDDFNYKPGGYLPERVRAKLHDLDLASTNTAEFEKDLLEERRWYALHRMGQTDFCTTVGVRYERKPAKWGDEINLVGFVLTKPQGLYFEVDFEEKDNPLKSLRLFPRGVTYDEVKERFPDDFYYFEHRAINHLRQVLSIRDKYDPVLHTPLDSIPNPLQLGTVGLEDHCGLRLDAPKVRKYVPLSDADKGLITGLLGSCFTQMRAGIWF